MRTEVYPGIFRTEQPAVTPGEHDDAVADQLQATTVEDLLDELYEVREPLQAAIADDDAEAIGLIVLAVRRAYAARCAERSLYERTFSPSAQDAAAAALLERAAAKASPRRFTGESPTGFGALS